MSGKITFSVEKADYQNLRLPAWLVEKMIEIVASRQPEKYETTKPDAVRVTELVDFQEHGWGRELGSLTATRTLPPERREFFARFGARKM